MPQNEMITVSNQVGDKMSIEISWQEDVWAWARTFRVILKWLEFAEVTIDKILPKDIELE